MRRFVAAAAVLVAFIAGGKELATSLGMPDLPGAPGPVTVDRWTGERPSRDQIEQLLESVSVLASRPRVPGYDRACGRGHGCVFGQAWSDDVDVPMGHNGCDTRNDMLRASLTAIELKPNTNNCVVMAGQLLDPYTGREIGFTKDHAQLVQVDHMIPLARAWDLGAARWSPEKRQAFANDPTNLLVVDGPANASKGDQGPGEWMPINRGFSCAYVHRYLKVATTYDLPLTRADLDAVRHTAKLCRTGTGS